MRVLGDLWALLCAIVLTPARPGQPPDPDDDGPQVQDPDSPLDYTTLKWTTNDKGQQHAFIPHSRQAEFVNGEQKRISRTARFTQKQKRHGSGSSRSRDDGVLCSTTYVCW